MDHTSSECREYHVDNIFYLFTDPCSSGCHPVPNTRLAHSLFQTWTALLPPAPHFHGHLLNVVCILEGEHDNIQGVVCVQRLTAQRPCPGSVGSCNDSGSEPSMYTCFTTIAYASLIPVSQRTAHTWHGGSRLCRTLDPHWWKYL